VEELTIRFNGKGTGSEHADHMVRTLCDTVKNTQCPRTLKCFQPNKVLIQKFIVRCLIKTVIFEYPSNLEHRSPTAPKPSGTFPQAVDWLHVTPWSTPDITPRHVTDHALSFIPTHARGTIRGRISLRHVRKLDLGGMFVTHNDDVSDIVTTVHHLTDLRLYLTD
jgi:hypothetical protein